jgi:hypothetical protein
MDTVNRVLPFVLAPERIILRRTGCATETPTASVARMSPPTPTPFFAHMIDGDIGEPMIEKRIVEAFEHRPRVGLGARAPRPTRSSAGITSFS